MEIEADKSIALHEPCHNRQFRLHASGRVGGGGSFVPVQPAQWRPGIVGLWEHRCWYWVDGYRNFIGRDGVAVGRSRLKAAHLGTAGPALIVMVYQGSRCWGSV